MLRLKNVLTGCFWLASCYNWCIYCNTFSNLFSIMSLVNKNIFYVFFSFLSLGLAAQSRLDKRVHRLVKPYDKVLEYLADVQEQDVADQMLFEFSQKTQLYQKSDIKQIGKVISKMCALQKKYKSLEKQEEVALLVQKLEKAQKYIVESATTYYAYIVYRDINQYYETINVMGADIILQINACLALQGKSVFKGRSLYQYVQKINIDSTRLHALFGHVTVSDDLVLQINALKIKLDKLKAKIITTAEYRSQRRKTKLLKAFGLVLGGVVLVVAPGVSLVTVSSVTGFYLTSWLSASVIVVAYCTVTVSELRTSMKYNIPVVSHSLFSGFTPTFWPLTWIPRTE